MKHILAVIVGIALVWAFSPTKGTDTVPVVVAPKSPVTAALSPASRQDKARVAAFYSAMADVVERDKSVVPTVGDFRTLHARSLDLAFKGTDLPGKYRGLDVAINATLVDAIGTDNTGLSEEKRAALVAALQKVAADAR